ncbi:MAG TPA: pyridoxal phosphate-dependent aminotransferase family protein [Candidatus Saccharimonadales bacterium]|nr:pyridoxal phosphate-dependent aminotransferase family protein [Candidatus Saccharimonadales bacterium]
MRTNAPTLPESLQFAGSNYVLSGRRKLLYFGGCDYFRLSRHPAIVEALERGLRKYGMNVSASRKTTGNHPLYLKVEKALATFFDSPRAILIGTGYMTNMVAAQALRGQFSHVFMDARSHPSLRDAARFLDCPILEFKHRNPADAGTVLKRCGPKATPLLCTDAMFSHDGSIAPLDRYLEVLSGRGKLLVDEAHSGGVIGASGKGIAAHFGIASKEIIRTVTLSKAFGLYGGAILCDEETSRAILTRSPMFTGHTPLPLPIAHAVLSALRLLRTDRTIRERLHRNARLIDGSLYTSRNGCCEMPTPIASWVPNNGKAARRLKLALLRAGIHPPLIYYPGGPEHGYFRFMISSEHTPAQIKLLVGVLQRHGAALTGR